MVGDLALQHSLGQLLQQPSLRSAAGPRCRPGRPASRRALLVRRGPAIRNRARRPGPPPSSHDGPLLVLPGGDLLLVALGGLAGRDLHASADAVQQQIQPGQGVLGAEPRRSTTKSSTGQRRRTGRPPTRPPARVVDPPRARCGHRRARGGPEPTARTQRPPPAVRRHRRHPEPPGHDHRDTSSRRTAQPTRAVTTPPNPHPRSLAALLQDREERPARRLPDAGALAWVARWLDQQLVRLTG